MAEQVPASGYAFDLFTIKKCLANLINQFDHKNLNDLIFFKNIPPTSENLCFVLWSEIKKEIPIRQVKVFETEKNVFTYNE